MFARAEFAFLCAPVWSALMRGFACVQGVSVLASALAAGRAKLRHLLRSAYSIRHALSKLGDVATPGFAAASTAGASVSDAVVSEASDRFHKGLAKCKALFDAVFPRWHPPFRHPSCVRLSPPVRLLFFCSRFSSTKALYGRGDGFRNDMLLHPHQEAVWKPQLASHSLASAALRGDDDTMNLALAYSIMITATILTDSALVKLTRQMLHSAGPVPVGEVGKLLQEAVGHPVMLLFRPQRCFSACDAFHCDWATLAEAVGACEGAVWWLEEVLGFTPRVFHCVL